MSKGTETGQLLFFAAAALIVAWHAWRGWRKGVVRQIIGVVAIILAWLAGYFGGPFTVLFLRPLGLPDQLLVVLGGVLLGAVVYVTISVLAAVVFKNTAQQGVGVIRWGYGGLGALVGAAAGLFQVWLLLLVLRLFGTVAQTGLDAAKHAPTRRQPPANPLVRGVAGIKASMDRGLTGAVTDHLDPVPDQLYRTLNKLGRTVASDRSISRFFSYPGVKPLAQHPKMLALKKDPSISRAALERNYLALLRNEHVVAAANDPEMARLVRSLDFEKALDFALQEKAALPPPAR